MSVTTEDLVLRNVYLAFPEFAEPSAFKGQDGTQGEAKYKTKVLIAKDNKPAVQALLSAVKAIADKEKINTKGMGRKEFCVSDGDDMDNEAYHGYYVLSLNSKFQPACFHRNNARMGKDEIREMLVSGVEVNVAGQLWGTKRSTYGSAMLRGNISIVQYVGQGIEFTVGGAANPFEALDSDGGGNLPF